MAELALFPTVVMGRLGQTEDHTLAMLFAARCFHSLSEMDLGDLACARYRQEFQTLKVPFKEPYGDSAPGWEKKFEEPL